MKNTSSFSPLLTLQITGGGGWKEIYKQGRWAGSIKCGIVFVLVV